MDMKRILQAMDSVSTTSVVGADSMAKFLRTVTEAEINQATAVKVPPIPQLPAQDGDQGNGKVVKTNQDGTRTYSGGFGRFTYDAQGKAITYAEPQFTGLGRSIDLTSNQTTQNYNTGPVNFSQTTDAKGNVVSHNAEYDVGVGKFSAGQDAKGITSKAYTPADGEHSIASKDMYALGNKDKEATYDRAMAQVKSAPVQEGIDKFLSIVRKNDVGILNESRGPHKVALPVQMTMQHYQQPEKILERKSSSIYKYFTQVEEEKLAEQTEKRHLINQYASQIAERIIGKKK